jgi:hypothetical protein
VDMPILLAVRRATLRAAISDHHGEPVDLQSMAIASQL